MLFEVDTIMLPSLFQWFGVPLPLTPHLTHHNLNQRTATKARLRLTAKTSIRQETDRSTSNATVPKYTAIATPTKTVMVEEIEWVIDPISRERLESTDIEAIRIKSQIYHLPTLVRYLDQGHGDTRLDPVSRTFFNEDDLERIDEKAKTLGLSRLRDDNERMRKHSISEEVLTYESIIGEVVAELLALIDTDMTSTRGPPSWIDLVPSYHFSPPSDEQHVEFKLTLLFSQFTEPFRILKLLSIEQAYFCFCQQKAFLRGSPKKPNRDGRNCVLSTTIKWLEPHWTEEDNQKLKLLRDLGGS